MTGQRNRDKPLQAMTWGDFLDLTKERGVALRRTEAPVRCQKTGMDIVGHYLARKVNGVLLFVPLPRDFTPEQCIGIWRLEAVCARLDVPIRFPGWYLPM